MNISCNVSISVTAGAPLNLIMEVGKIRHKKKIFYVTKIKDFHKFAPFTTLFKFRQIRFYIFLLMVHICWSDDSIYLQPLGCQLILDFIFVANYLGVGLIISYVVPY